MSVVANPEAAFRVVLRALSRDLLAVVGAGRVALIHGFVETVRPDLSDDKVTDFSFTLRGVEQEFRWSEIRSFQAGSHHVERAR